MSYQNMFHGHPFFLTYAISGQSRAKYS